MRQFFVATSLAMLVSACGGGSGSDGGDNSSQTVVVDGTGAVDDTGGIDYPRVADQVNQTSGLGGTFVKNAGSVTSVSGDFDHSDGTTRFSDGTVTLNASSGNGLTDLDDGTTVVSVFAGSGLSIDFQFLAPVTISSPAGSGSAIIGLTTDVADMPTSSTATYGGQTSLSVATGGGAFEMSGTAQTNVNFGTNRVDVTLGNFSNSSNPAPFDELRLNNMTISGAGYSGGTLTTLQDGSTVTPLGSGATLASRGNFFGFDSENTIPAEVGGGFRANGVASDSDKLITGIYTGD